MKCFQAHPGRLAQIQMVCAGCKGRQSCSVKKRASKQLRKVKNASRNLAEKDCFRFYTREFGLVGMVDKTWGKERKKMDKIK